MGTIDKPNTRTEWLAMLMQTSMYDSMLRFEMHARKILAGQEAHVDRQAAERAALKHACWAHYNGLSRIIRDTSPALGVCLCGGPIWEDRYNNGPTTVWCPDCGRESRAVCQRHARALFALRQWWELRQVPEFLEAERESVRMMDAAMKGQSHGK